VIFQSDAQAESVALENLPQEFSTQVLTNAADDCARCSAFYQITSECMNRTTFNSGAVYGIRSVQILETAAVMLMLSDSISLNAAGQDFDEDDLFDKSQEKVFDWYQREYDSMLVEANTCANLNILITQYREPCDTYSQHPEVLLGEWVRKIDSEEGGD
jgi:hypothetical protein